MLRKLILSFNQFKKLKGRDSAEKRKSEFDLLSTHSKGGPPLHWLNKVHEEAPHFLGSLLSKYDISSNHVNGLDVDIQRVSADRKKISAGNLSDSRNIPGSSRNNPPADWIARVQRKALHLLKINNAKKSYTLNLYSTDKKIVGFIKKSFIDVKQSIIKKAFITGSPVARQHSSSRKKFDSLSSIISERNKPNEGESYFATNPTKHSVVEKANFYRRLLEENNNTILPDSFSKNKSISFNRSMMKLKERKQDHEIKKKIIFYPISDVHNGFNTKRYSNFEHAQPTVERLRQTKWTQLRRVVSESQLTLEKSVKVHWYSRTIKKGSNGLIDYSNNSPAHSFSNGGNNAIKKSLDRNKSNISNATNSHISINSINYPYQKVAAGNKKSNKTDKPVNSKRRLDFIPGKNQSQGSSKFTESNEQLLLNKSLWPNLPDEVEVNIFQNPWPKLSNYEIEQSSKFIEFDQVNSLYFRLLEVANRATLNDLEQRGKLWNE